MGEEGVVGHHGSGDIVVGDEAAMRTKERYNALVVHDGLCDARFPGSTWADERDVFAFEDLGDNLLNDIISPNEYIRRRGDMIAMIGRGHCGGSIMQDSVRRTRSSPW